jgi:membrane associated rhomboid family serine protease
LLKFALKESAPQGRYGKSTLLLAGLSGFVTTVLGILLAFFPAQQITSLALYEVWMVGGTLFFIGLAAFFFFVYGRRKIGVAAVAAPISPLGEGQVPSSAQRREAQLR